MKLRTRLSAVLLAGCMTATVVPMASASSVTGSQEHSLGGYDYVVTTREITYGSDGSQSTRDFSYDDHGNIIQVNNSNGQQRLYDRTYDKLGNETAVTIRSIQDGTEATAGEYRWEYVGREQSAYYAKQDGAWLKTTYSYKNTDTGTQETQVYYDSEGKLYSTTVIDYNTDGDTLSTSTTDASGKLKDKDTYTYNNAGLLLTSENYHIYGIDGVCITTSTYEYDSNGFEVKRTTATKYNDNEPSTDVKTTKYELDDKNRIVSSDCVFEPSGNTAHYESTYYDNDNTKTYKYVYNGKPSSYDTFDENGNKTAEYYAFDESGNPIKDRDCTYYEYGNLADLLKDNVSKSFTDVKTDEYYALPILWAVNNGITNGIGDSQFAPGMNCTRGQIVTFLWRMAGEPEPNNTTNTFTDVDVNDYYGKAVLWAVENGITNGMGDNKFEPNTTCTRGQTVTFIWRAYGEPTPTASTSTFTDVNVNDYYGKAVLWAVENEVTNGMGDNKFEPNTTCTRGHIVTFLYRAFAEQSGTQQIPFNRPQ